MMYPRTFAAVVAALAIRCSALLVVPRSLPSGTVTCSSNSYSPSDLTAAITAGIDDLNNGNLQGMLLYCDPMALCCELLNVVIDNYPHQCEIATVIYS